MSKVKALLIGVCKYTSNRCCDLPLCAYDVEAVKSALIVGLNILESDIIICGHDGIVTIEDVNTEFKFLTDQITNEETFIFYFSGHGGKNVLALSDGNINLQILIDKIEKIPVKNKIIILDSCYSGNFAISDTPGIDLLNTIETFAGYWFLGELGNNWSDVCADELATYGKVLEVPQQEEFYRSRIKTSDTKVFVIISDAMRYEVAAAMADQLQRETQSKVSISSMQSIFPSITKFGMAALLPHKELTVEVRNDSLTVLADGQSTASTYRDKVLKAEDPASVALKYNDIIAMKRAERSALVKGMDVVYIYHDTIDEASHISDTAVFSACDKAISELKNLVRIIVNEFGGTNILITADHGFLYTYSPLTEDDKADKSSFNGMDVEYGRRYAIMQKGAQPNYLLPVKFLGGNTEFDGFAPRESIRIKMNGGGMNFVHGGISLQEMVVPLIEYHYLRNDSMEYKRNKQKYDTKPVTVNLLSANRKISNMIFSLNFYQKDAVSANREAATYQVYFTDENGKQISDVQKIIADKISDNGAERTFRCQFNLKSLKYSNTATYYLIIADEQGLQMPQREPFQIDIAFAVDEFDFFS